MENKYLKLARRAREENNTEDAKKFYDMARTEDPENVEAKFFYAYYNLNDAINRDVPNKYVDYTKVAISSIKLLKEVTMEESEKIELLTTIINVHVKEAVSTYYYVNRKSGGENGIYTISQSNMVQVASVTSLDEIGNIAVTLFGEKPEAMELAAKCWKTIFTGPGVFSQWYFFKSAGTKEQSAAKWKELVAKIQKIDSSFTTPKEPKAIQCGTK